MWIHKEKSVPLNVIEKQMKEEVDAKVRAAFWARRVVQTSQPRKRLSDQVLTTEYRRHFATQIKH